MNYPIVCEYCGSDKLRLSRWHSTKEKLRIALGTYPFRCLSCEGRFYANVFLLSRLAYAKCPKCLSLDISYSKRTFRPGLLRRFMLTFGARRCRCDNCRYMFVSFRPLSHPQIFETEPSDEAAEPEVPVNTEPKEQI